MTFDDVIELMKKVADIPPDLLEEVVNDKDECANWLVDKLFQVQQCYIPRFTLMIEELHVLLDELDKHLNSKEHDQNSICWHKRAAIVQGIQIMNERLEAAYALQFAIRSFLLEEEPN